MRLKNESFDVVSETGEIVTTHKTYSTRISPDAFYMTFVGKMAGFYKLKSAVDMKVLAKMCELAQFDTGRVLIPSAIRKEIAEELEISNQQITKAIASLKSKSLITGSHGAYNINPEIFWKGSMDMRTKFLKEGSLKIEVEFKAE